jgi:hypothetical protein
MKSTYLFLAAHEICQIDNLTTRLQYICKCITQPQQAIIWQDTALFTEQHRSTVTDNHLPFVGSY